MPSAHLTPNQRKALSRVANALERRHHAEREYYRALLRARAAGVPLATIGEHVGGITRQSMGVTLERWKHRWGVERAAAWYEAQGYRVVEREWQGPKAGRGGRGRDGKDKATLDLVVERPGELVVCQVKTRWPFDVVTSIESVDRSEQRRTQALAQQVLAEHGDSPSVRYDLALVTVTGEDHDEIEVREAAFTPA